MRTWMKGLEILMTKDASIETSLVEDVKYL